MKFKPNFIFYYKFLCTNFQASIIKFLMIVLLLNFSQNVLATNATNPIPASIDLQASTENQENVSCDILTSKITLITGWFEWEPYQFQKRALDGSEITGLDIALVNAIANAVGSDATFVKGTFEQNILDIKSGNIDIIPGATYSKERSSYAYFSEPYRYQEYSIFVSKKSGKSLKFNNIEEFLIQIKAMNFKIGVENGAIYADERINSFINDPLNADIVIKNNDDISSFRSMMKGQIDGFITDRIGGANILVKNASGDLVKEIPLNIKTPISLMLSKKTISPDFLAKINNAIINLKQEGEYHGIMREYIYPVFLLRTISSDWFYYVALLGVIAFALSGVAIAARDNMTLFGTFFLAFLPSFGGGMLRDIFGGGRPGMQDSSLYICVVLAIVLVGFSFVRILDVFNKDATKDKLMQDFWRHFFDLTDAMGHAAFIVTGVTIVIVAKLSPIEVWGPVFAFLASNGGGMFRDLFTNDKQISALNGDINAEVSIVWGLIFSIFLKYNANEPDLSVISLGVVFVIIGAFLSRLATIYFKISNIRFK